ncbi:MAG: class I SAM-dependent methyltransferase [Maribacter sp.]|uniref:class I SAM-dependent methyltransferase n=1 Tax=Maribacter sp. TaxID=1897614 RepID=UPI0032993AF9
METIRKPFQGITNIIRFNWHFYALSLGLALVLFYLSAIQTPIPRAYSLLLASVIVLTTLISLAVSLYIYDTSGLYALKWLDKLAVDQPDIIVNVNAGFDETSALFAKKYSRAELFVLDFYDPIKHTEVSIKRARKAYPPYPNTLQIKTDTIPLENDSATVVFAILSAHEIREDNERISFFKELNRILKTGGKIVVTEHLRDLPNFLAYTVGFFHFHSKSTWFQTFKAAGLEVSQEIKITPFLTTFVLQNA